jgi:hypothetical protein
MILWNPRVSIDIACLGSCSSPKYGRFVTAVDDPAMPPAAWAISPCRYSAEPAFWVVRVVRQLLDRNFAVRIATRHSQRTHQL